MQKKEKPGSLGGDTGQTKNIPQSNTFAFDNQSIFSNIVTALNGKNQSDGSAMVLCPAHADKNPSLHITNSGDKVLVHCMAGCSQDSVISALQSKGLWPEKFNGSSNSLRPAGIPAKWGRGTDRKDYVTHWPYHDQHGSVIGHVARYQLSDNKDVVPFFKQYDPVFGSINQGPRWKAGAAPVPRPLYNLHLVGRDSMSDRAPLPVLIPEGEKACEAAKKLVGTHYLCITWPGGSKAANKADWAPLQGRHVVIWPDADEPGKNAALAVKEHCLKAGAKSCKIVTPPQGVSQGWDLADAKDEGWTAKQVLAHIAGNTDGGDEDTQNQWDNPVDMQDVLFEPPPTIKFLVDNRIQANRGIGITGVGGSSKTRIVYTLAIGAITGKLPWSWEIERTGKAVLVLTEDTAEDVHRVVWSLTRDLTEEERKKVADNLIIYPLAGKDTRLLVKNPNGTVEKSTLYYSLLEKIKSIGDVVFVGLDPALGITEGDEMDQGHQRALGKAVDDMAVNAGATVALVCHAAKGSLLKEELDSHNARGGGGVTDALRGEFAIRNMTAKEGSRAGITDIEERKRHVQIVATKGNNLPPSAFVPAWMRRDDFGNLTEAYVDMDGNEGTLTDRDIEILKVHSRISVHTQPKLGEWRDKCIEERLITGSTDAAQKQAMKRVLARLMKAGRIRKGMGRGIYVQEPDKEETPF